MNTFEEAARAATAVVNDPSVVAKIREAAGIADPDLIVIDTDWFTIDEIDQIEQRTGQPFPRFMNGGGPMAGELRILGLLIRRRTDPDFPEERAGSLKVTFKNQRQRLRTLVAVAGHYGITLAEVRSLRLWEFNQLVTEMNREARRKAGGKRRGR